MKANVVDVRLALKVEDEVDLPQIMELLANVIPPDSSRIRDIEIVGLQLLHSAPIELKVSNLDPSSPFSKH